jgi:hypothetical protein
MKYVKKLDSFKSLDEMAKSWPVGMIVKCNNINDLSGAYSGGDKWSSWRPGQADKVEGGGFYMKITESGRSWLVGKVLYTNGFSEMPDSSKVYRFRTTYAETPTTEWKIIEKNGDEIRDYLYKTFFIEGDEPGIMNNIGEKAVGLTESEYTVKSLNFKLTDLYDEPVFVLFSKNNSSKNFSIKMSDLSSLTKELSNEQREVVAEWFSKELKADVVVNGTSFQIEQYKVVANSGDDFPSSFSAGPFISKEQADNFIEKLKEEKTTLFKTASLRVDTDRWSKTNLNLEQLINFSKALGINITMKQLLTMKRGASTGKKFGL